MKDPRFENLVPALRRYVAWTVPFPRRTEVSRWAISAVPAVNVSTSPRLMTLTIQSLETLYVCAPVNEQTRADLPMPISASGARPQRSSPCRLCTCRKCHPGRSGSMFVFVEDASEAVVSVDVQVGEPVRIGDRFGQRCQWPDVGDALSHFHPL